jgi:hypothetical protein
MGGGCSGTSISRLLSPHIQDYLQPGLGVSRGSGSWPDLWLTSLPFPTENIGAEFKVMRANLTVVAVLVFVSADAATAERDRELCQRLSQLSQGLAAGVSREITLLTDYSEPPTIACRRQAEDPVAEGFCDWFVEHASIEFMEVNVWKVIACVADTDLSVYPIGRGNPVSGVLRFDGVKLASDVSVNVEVEYAIDARDPPDSLRVSMVGRSSD